MLINGEENLMEKKILVPLDGTNAGEMVLYKLEDLVLKSITGA